MPTPGSKGERARVNLIAQQFALPGRLGLLGLGTDPGIRLPVEIVPTLEGEAAPEQARRCVGGHERRLYQERPRAAHGVRQRGACMHVLSASHLKCMLPLEHHHELMIRHS